MKKSLSLIALLFAMIMVVPCLSANGKNGNTQQANPVETNAVRSGQYGEAPSLAELVKSGALPPVNERLPLNPRREKVGEIGKFGGVYKSAGMGATTGQLDAEGLRWTSLLTIEPDLHTLTPMVIDSYSYSEDLSEYTLKLRNGLKWSNGDPVTADDFLFWYNDILLNQSVSPTVAAMYKSSNGTVMKMEKISDYEIKISFDAPYPSFDLIMTTNLSGPTRNFVAPKNYLKKWHLTYNKDANTLAKNEGYESWALCFLDHIRLDQGTVDKDAPTLEAWVLQEVKANGNRVYLRNPYFFVVDQDGNQLPYFDKQEVFILQDTQMRTMKIIAGEIHASAEYGSAMLADYTIYKENEKSGDFKTYQFGNTRGSDVAWSVNFTCKNDDLRNLFNLVEFREALSLALNREAMNQTLYKGQSMIRQATAAYNTSFLDPSIENYMIDYDVDKANALLDKCGLKWNSSKTRRTLPNGQELSIVLETYHEHATASEMAVEFWQAVGLNIQLKVYERALFQERVMNNEPDMVAHTFDGVGEPVLRQNSMNRFSPSRTSNIDLAPWVDWKAWFDTNGEKGAEPPEQIKQLEADCNRWGSLLPSDPEYAELGKSILKRNVEGMWYIGVGSSPRIVVISNKIGNAPHEGFYAYDFLFWKPYKGWTWFLR